MNAAGHTGQHRRATIEGIPMPFLAAANLYLNLIAHVRRLSPHSVAAYRADLTCFASRHPGSPAELTAGTLTEHIAWLTRERGLAAASVRRHAASLRSFIRFAVEQKLCDPALAAWRPLLKRVHRLPRPVSRVEMRQLVSSPAKHDAELAITAILLMAGTGLRIGELCALRVGDLEPDVRSILILGKGARERIVYVANANLRGRLKTLMGQPMPDGEVTSSAPLFRARDKRPLTTAALRRQIQTLAKRTGLVRPVSPHMFRHSAATWLIEEGIDIRTVQRLLGHASIATTEIYTHVADRLLEQSLKRVDVLRRVAG